MRVLVEPDDEPGRRGDGQNAVECGDGATYKPWDGSARARGAPTPPLRGAVDLAACAEQSTRDARSQATIGCVSPALDASLGGSGVGSAGFWKFFFELAFDDDVYEQTQGGQDFKFGAVCF